jgi:hypothetical protein
MAVVSTFVCGSAAVCGAEKGLEEGAGVGEFVAEDGARVVLGGLVFWRRAGWRCQEMCWGFILKTAVKVK